MQVEEELRKAQVKKEDPAVAAERADQAAVLLLLEEMAAKKAAGRARDRAAAKKDKKARHKHRKQVGACARLLPCAAVVLSCSHICPAIEGNSYSACISRLDKGYADYACLDLSQD